MPQLRRPNVEYPLGGENRRLGYAQKTQPYTCPRALNVRGVDAIENRVRGGSRPGLAKVVDNDFGTNILGVQSVTYLDNDGNHQVDLVVIADGVISTLRGAVVSAATSYWKTDSGDFIVTDDGDYIVFNTTVSSTNTLLNDTAFQMVEHNGKVYIADSSLTAFNPRNGNVDIVQNAPTSQPLVCAWQERIVLAGANHLVYMSRQGNPEDWDFADDMDDAGRAVIGHVGSGVIGDVPIAMCAKDKYLILATTDSIHAFIGNPAGNGIKMDVPGRFGVISPGAMTITDDGYLIFMSRIGIMKWKIGSDAPPVPLSDLVVPEEMHDIAVATNDVLLAYDSRRSGVHVFITPAAASVGSHWWIDLDRNAFWPVQLPQTMQPWALGVLQTSGYSDIVLCCKDGYLRRFADTATTDDGTNIQSDVFFGPFHVPGAEGYDGQIMELVGALAAGSGSVTVNIVTASSAEAVVDKAATCLDGDRSTGIEWSTTWTAGQNLVDYPRSRGAWAILWFSSTAQWAFSSALMAMARHGRLR